MQSKKLILIMLFSITAVHTMASTSMESECTQRIEKLDKDLKQVLNPKSYPRKNRKAFKRAARDAHITKSSYQGSLLKLKKLNTKNNSGILPDGNALKCLLEAGSLVQELDKLANHGGKNLDDFSKDWQKYFPGYAKKMGYSL